MRDCEVLRTIKGSAEWKPSWRTLKLRLATQIAESQQAFGPGGSLSAGAEWREELAQAMELVAEVMKDKLASLPRPRMSPHTWEELWNKWPGQWAAFLRIFLPRAAVDVAEFEKKAQGTVYATGCLD